MPNKNKIRLQKTFTIAFGDSLHMQSSCIFPVYPYNLFASAMHLGAIFLFLQLSLHFCFVSYLHCPSLPISSNLSSIPAVISSSLAFFLLPCSALFPQLSLTHPLKVWLCVIPGINSAVIIILAVQPTQSLISFHRPSASYDSLHQPCLTKWHTPHRYANGVKPWLYREIRDVLIIGCTMHHSIQHWRCIPDSEDKGCHKLATVLLVVLACKHITIILGIPNVLTDSNIYMYKWPEDYWT